MKTCRRESIFSYRNLHVIESSAAYNGVGSSLNGDPFLRTLFYSAVFYQRTGVLKADAVACIAQIGVFDAVVPYGAVKIDAKVPPCPVAFGRGGRIAVIIAVPTLRIVVYRGQGDALLSRSI